MLFKSVNGKSQFRKGLERVLASGIIFVGSLVGNVRAGDIKVINDSPNVVGTSMNIKHVQGATENYDFLYDVSYISDNPNKLHIYSYNPNCLPDTDKLSIDSRDPNSTTSYVDELYNKTFTGTAQNFLKFKILDSNDLEWENIIAERYGLDDVNNPANIKNKWDVKRVNDVYLALPDVSGSTAKVYDRIKINFFNRVDLNRDRKVNGLDFAILGNEWGKSNETDPNRFGSYVGKEVNDLGAYADIDRSGAVDINDLGIYCSEYLWDANDPNTY